MKRGDFYEDDEPLADVQAAFAAGQQAVTAAPARGWTYWLAADMTLRELSTCGIEWTDGAAAHGGDAP